MTPVALGQVAHYVFTFVPLAALYQGPLTECLLDCRLETLAAVDDHQQTLGDIASCAKTRPS